MPNKKKSKKSKSKASGQNTAAPAQKPPANTANRPSSLESPTSSAKKSKAPTHWQSYGLDQIAQRLVLNAIDADPDSLNQSYKMRMATSYGLERFWGEHLRLRNSKKETDKKKADYWKATWDELVKTMDKAGVSIPNHAVSSKDTAGVRLMSEALWQLDVEVQRVSLAVLTQMCDCIVWWTQRYKGIK